MSAIFFLFILWNPTKNYAREFPAAISRPKLSKNWMFWCVNAFTCRWRPMFFRHGESLIHSLLLSLLVLKTNHHIPLMCNLTVIISLHRDRYRKINHLSRYSNDLETWWYCGKKLVNGVNFFSVRVSSGSYVALYSQTVNFENFNGEIRVMSNVSV